MATKKIQEAWVQFSGLIAGILFLLGMASGVESLALVSVLYMLAVVR